MLLNECVLKSKLWGHKRQLVHTNAEDPLIRTCSEGVEVPLRFPVGQAVPQTVRSNGD